MPERQAILLTGATGLLGQYILQELLARGYAVTVLVRDSRQLQAEERIKRLVTSWSERLGRKLPSPVVLKGDLVLDSLGLSTADRRWLGQHCKSVVHAAANLSLRDNPDGEPSRTNLAGTHALLTLCRDLVITEWHHVSTAFVCGSRTGSIAEDDLQEAASFHNAYEESKYHAELLVRSTPGIRATIYRPSVIVGDSLTGYTSTFHGLYRFLELTARLAAPGSAFRVPLSGDEVWNLVPVDWVSRAVVELLAKPRWHGRTFHLVSPLPVSTAFVAKVGADILNIPVEFAGRAGGRSSSRLEQLFLDGIREYWPYLDGNPTFACSNTREALPGLLPSVMDRPLLERLIRFAVVNRWGRSAQREPGSSTLPTDSCAAYVEHVFPQQARRSRLARLAGLDLTVGIDVRGPGGGKWSCTWSHGDFIHTRSGVAPDAAVVYHTDAATFQAVVSGREAPQEAFFQERIAISGDVETGLKLAVLFGRFLVENAASRPNRKEVRNSTLIAS